jgi:hypothetical protein
MKAKGQSVAFKLSKRQLAERDALVISLREKAAALNVAIAAFNHAIEPNSSPSSKHGMTTMRFSRRLAPFPVVSPKRRMRNSTPGSERCQQSDKGIQVRSWIEQWELNLDDIDLEMPEPLTEIDPDERALEIEDAPPNPTE